MARLLSGPTMVGSEMNGVKREYPFLCALGRFAFRSLIAADIPDSHVHFGDSGAFLQWWTTRQWPSRPSMFRTFLSLIINAGPTCVEICDLEKK